MDILTAIQFGKDSKKPIRRPSMEWVSAETLLYRQLLNSIFVSDRPSWWITEEDFFANDWEVQS